MSVDEIESIIKLSSEPIVQEKLKLLKKRLIDLDEYLKRTSSPSTELQTKIWEETRKENWSENFGNKVTASFMPLGMISGHLEGQFLRIIAEIMKAERILEIGMFTGFSAITFAQSPHAKQIIALEDELYCEKFMRKRIDNDEIGKMIRVLNGPALEGLQTLKQEGQKFDLVFIDADKKNYINYYKFIMDNSLLNTHGAFLIDNTLWSGQVYPTPSSPMGKLIYDFNEFVRNDDRVIQITIPLRDGITLIKPKVAGGVYGK